MASQQNKRRSTRSKSLGRKPSGELQTAISSAQPSSRDSEKSGAELFSPTRNGRLPSKQSPEIEMRPRESNPTLETRNISISDNTNDKKGEKGEPGSVKDISPNSQSEKSAESLQHQVSDNKGNSTSGTDDLPGAGVELPPSAEENAWHATFQELRAMRLEMASLGSIKKTVEQHTEQISDILHRTSGLEKSKDNTEATIRELRQEISSLKETVSNQGQSISNLSKLSKDLTQSNAALKEELTQSTNDTIKEMNDLIQTQRDQVDSFNETTGRFKQDVTNECRTEIKTEIKKIREECNYKSMQSKANSNQQNLVFTGLREEKDKTPLATVSEFIKSTLKIKNVDIDVAYRLGAAPEEDSTYIRPLVVRFARVSDRTKVWKNKIDITAEDSDQKIRISADLPKRLRDDSQLLSRVARAAARIPKFQSAKNKGL